MPNQMKFHESQVPKPLIWAIIVICVLPFLLNLLGVDFGNQKIPLELSTTAGLEKHEQVDVLHHTLAGSFTHTILEWSAFCIAIFVAILAFLHFSITRDVATPVIGVALFCAGTMDAFHTLAADRLINAVADNLNLIPFTWAICRIFNAIIMISGVSIFLIWPIETRKTGFRFVAVISLVFGIVAYFIIHVCATSKHLPITMFPDSIVTRPYDIAPLVLFVIAGIFIYPRFYRRAPSLFSHALIISAVPEIATQLYMAFGSKALFDNYFNIAHFLKIIAYFVPFVGLMLDYVYTYHKQRLVAEQLGEAQEDLAQRTLQLEKINSRLHDELVERTQMEKALKQTLTKSETTRAELTAFNRFAVNRELRMIELKEQVNNLLTAQGEVPMYQTDTIEEGATHG